MFHKEVSFKRGDREERERGSLVVLENSIVLSEWLNDVERKKPLLLTEYTKTNKIAITDSLCIQHTHTTHTHSDLVRGVMLLLTEYMKT